MKILTGFFFCPPKLSAVYCHETKEEVWTNIGIKCQNIIIVSTSWAGVADNENFFQQYLLYIYTHNKHTYTDIYIHTFLCVHVITKCLFCKIALTHNPTQDEPDV